MIQTLLFLSVLLASPDLPAEPYPFVEVTEEVGLDFVHWNGMTGELYFSETPGGGGALFDFDLDGDLDLYVVQGRLLNPKKTVSDARVPPPPGPLRHRLYRNDLLGPDGKKGPLRFVDVTEASGLDERGYGMGVAVGDYDNDGRPDLYVTNFGPNSLWRNRGPGKGGAVTFEKTTDAAGVDDTSWSVPAAFVDLDADGRLDLYVGNYLDFRIANHKPCFGKSGEQDYCGPSAYPPVPDRLFHNRGPGKDGRVTFSDVSATSGISRGKGGALGVVSGDFDGDDRLDLYVANDQTANHLWIVEKTSPLKLREAALFSGAAVNGDGLAEASMGVDAGDVDLDGDDDLFIAHLTQETNTLYLNDGSGFFEDASAAAGLALPSFAFTGFGTRLVDYDNDGLLDVVVVNGAIKTLEELARVQDPFPLHQPDQLFKNLGNGRFREVTSKAGPAFRESRVSRGLAAGDLDNDGDADLVIFNNHGATRVLRNGVGQDAGWIGLDLRTGKNGRTALGSRVEVRSRDRVLAVRRVRTEGSYASASDPRVLVGLGDDPPAAVDVLVRWHGRTDGPVEELWKDLAVGRYHRLDAGKAPPAPTAPP